MCVWRYMPCGARALHLASMTYLNICMVLLLGPKLRMRTEILATKNLNVSNFASAQEASDAADQLVQLQARLKPELLELFPAKLFPNMPVLDQFYYINEKGICVCVCG